MGKCKNGRVGVPRASSALEAHVMGQPSHSIEICSVRKPLEVKHNMESDSFSGYDADSIATEPPGA